MPHRKGRLEAVKPHLLRMGGAALCFFPPDDAPAAALLILIFFYSRLWYTFYG